MAAESKTAIYAALAGNTALALTKLGVAAVTGSSAMLSEGIHSLVDTGNSGLLLLGIHLSKRPADESHPFGHGLELYFWSLIVSILVFAVGGGMSVYEGITHLLDPREIENHMAIYLVLGCGVVFEGASLYFAIRSFRATMGQRSVWETIHLTKDPTTFAVVLEDSAAMIGLFTAFVGISLGQLFANPYLDGVASIVIGVLLMVVASILAWESRQLMLGEGADPGMVSKIQEFVTSDKSVVAASRPLTMHFGPENVLVNLDVQFDPGLSVDETVTTVERLERGIRDRYPSVKRIYLEARVLNRQAGTAAQ